MKLSIALASYNGVNYIQDQLDSFVRQTRQPDQLIISDDGSSDGTLEVIEKFQKTAPFEVLVLSDQENLGYAGNFNRALRAATGDLVFLSDQDDVWFPEKMEKMEKFSRNNPDSLVIMCDAELTDGALNPVGLTKLGQIQSGGLGMSSFVMGCCAAVRREFLDMVLPIPKGYPAHDTWLMYIADGIGGKLVLNEPLQYYRRHEGNKSGFIANRTSRISRRHVFQERLRRTLIRDSLEREPFKQQISSYTQLIYGVQRALNNADEKWIEALMSLIGKLESKLECFRARAEIRQSSLIYRIPKVVSLWWHGGYSNFSGWKSAIRDLVSK